MCFAVCINHECVDLFAILECLNHRKSTVRCGERHFHEFECVIDCHCGESGGGVDACVHITDDGVGEVDDGVGEGADCDLGGCGWCWVELWVVLLGSGV